jgi:glutathione S-transferase
MFRALDVTTSMFTSVASLGRGFFAAQAGPRPAERLVLYEFEACPFCRRVRETITALDLDVLIKPCPKGGTRFRTEVIERGGKAQFPYLVDPNTDTAMYESADIVRHLFQHYGTGPAPLWLNGPHVIPTSMIGSAFRLGLGNQVRPSRAPDQPLELWGMDASPYTRIAREALSELELPYILHTTPKGSASWREVKKLGGKGMVPFLVDLNHDHQMYESAEIRDYLRKTYGTGG